MPFLRSTLIALSRNHLLRNFLEDSWLGARLSSRFVAGTHVDQALAATAAVNSHGMAATLDSLGENVHSPEEARHSAGVYHAILDAMAERRLNANISLKLTQMGMDLDPDLALGLTAQLVEHAAEADTFVRVDMEGSAYTQATVDLVSKLHSIPAHRGRVGVVIQSYLYRSQQDVERLVAEGIRIRLCKGAYQEPASVAFPEKADVDKNFVRLMQLLLSSGLYHGIATHDEHMIDATRRYAREQQIARDQFEFQMLYGVRRDLQKALIAEGYRVRVYIPFGTEWYPYFMRRLAERPANLLFLARNLVR